MTEPLIRLPGRDLQEAFATVVGPTRGLLTKLLETTEVLTEMRDRLLPKLVMGEIDVSDLDLDSLASSVG